MKVVVQQPPRYTWVTLPGFNSGKEFVSIKFKFDEEHSHMSVEPNITFDPLYPALSITNLDKFSKDTLLTLLIELSSKILTEKTKTAKLYTTCFGIILAVMNKAR